MVVAALVAALVAITVGAVALFIAVQGTRLATLAHQDVQKLHTLPLEWETALRKMTSIAGRVDKNAALLRATADEPPEAPNGNGAAPSSAAPVPHQKNRSRLELLSLSRR